LKQKWSKNSRLRKNKLKIEGRAGMKKLRQLIMARLLCDLPAKGFIPAQDHCFHSPAEQIFVRN